METADSAVTSNQQLNQDAPLKCGPVEVDPATRKLVVDDQEIALERRAFDLLVYLMRHSDRVVDKDELWREVWNSRPVSDASLPQAVSRARKALGGESPDTYIANVYGVGYRFAQMVESAAPVALEPQPGPEAEIAAARPRIGYWPVAALLAVIAVFSFWQPWQDRGGEETIRIAVLPVQNDTGDTELEWVRLGVLPLIDRTLADAGVTRVSTGTVLSTLRRYPNAVNPEAQAEVLQLSSGADQVIVPRLTVSEAGYQLDLTPIGYPDDKLTLSFQGDDVSVLSVAAGTSLSESLARWQGATRARSSLVTDDPFVNEAFIRGLDARLRGRHEDAARYFDTVLAAVPDLHEAKYHLSLVTRRLGDWDYTDQLNRELLASAQSDGDRSMLAAVQSVSGTLAWRRGDKQAAEQWYGQSLANYEALGNADYVASVTGNLGMLSATRGDYDAAERQFTSALNHYEQSGDRYNEATVRKNLGNLYSDQGRYDEAEAMLLSSLAIRQELDLPLQVALTLSVLADVEMVRGNWTEGLAYQESVFETAQQHDHPVLQAQALSDMASALRRLGRLEESRMNAARAMTIATELNNPSNLAFALLQQGRAEHELGHTQRAAELFAEAGTTYERIDEPLGQAISLIAGAEALTQSGQTDEAQRLLVRAAEVIEGTQIRRLDASLANAQANLALMRKDSSAALEHMDKAYQHALDGEMPVEKLDMGGALGLLLLSLFPDDPRLPDLVESLSARAEASADALAFLSQYYRSSDAAKALDLAERRKRLVGEGWTPQDEQTLSDLRNAVQSVDG